MSNDQPPPPNQPPPPYQPPPPGQPYQQPYGASPVEPPKKKRSGCLVALAVVGVLAILGVIAVVVIAALAVNSVEDALDEASAELDADQELPPVTEDVEGGEPVATEATEEAVIDEGGEEPAAGESTAAGGDEALDVTECQIIDENTVSFALTNNSSKQSSYIIDANYLDGSGARIGDEPFFVNYIRPGETAVEPSFGVVPDGGVTCEIAEVERFAAESDDDIGEVTCAVAGVDFVDDIATELVATNGSSKLSDYLISFAIVRNDVRVGSGFASIDNVRPGESAPGDGFSSVDGPAEGATCEVVHVTRIASE